MQVDSIWVFLYQTNQFSQSHTQLDLAGKAQRRASKLWTVYWRTIQGHNIERFVLRVHIHLCIVGVSWNPFLQNHSLWSTSHQASTVCHKMEIGKQHMSPKMPRPSLVSHPKPCWRHQFYGSVACTQMMSMPFEQRCNRFNRRSKWIFHIGSAIQTIDIGGSDFVAKGISIIWSSEFYVTSQGLDHSSIQIESTLLWAIHCPWF